LNFLPYSEGFKIYESIEEDMDWEDDGQNGISSDLQAVPPGVISIELLHHENLGGDGRQIFAYLSYLE
jgi:hypothetical protein